MKWFYLSSLFLFCLPATAAVNSNTTHIPGLKRMGIIRSENELLSNVCLNIQTGAWILARHFQQCGVNWECLGSYNAGFNKNNTHRRMKYARLIYAAYMQGR